MATRSPYKDPRYREIRARILSAGPTCVYCGTRKADTIDHIVEVDQGGEHTSENCVPACYKCNSAKGARYGNAKKAAATKARNAAVKAGPAAGAQKAKKNAFLAQNGDPDPPMLAISPKKIGRAHV